MAKVLGIGGIFFKAKDPKKLQEWYEKNLGLSAEHGFVMFENQKSDLPKKGYTLWTPFEETTTYFNPSTKPFMINFQVDNLVELLQELRVKGVEVDEKTEESEFGKFGWIMDPEGNKVELWEPAN